MGSKLKSSDVDVVTSMASPLRFGSDCTGLGTDTLAAKELKLNFKKVFGSENDPIVRHHLKTSPGMRPEKLFNTAGKADCSVDVYCCGFPCQPYSSAGKRKGVEDKRDLSGTVANYITTKQPTVFILENVCGFKQGRQKVEGGENKSEMVGFFDFLT